MNNLVCSTSLVSVRCPVRSEGYSFTIPKLVVFDVKTGKVIGSVDIAPGTDQIAYDPEWKRVYCASKGFVSVVQATADGAELVANVPSPAGVHTIAVDPSTHSVWVCYADTAHSYVQQFKARK